MVRHLYLDAETFLESKVDGTRRVGTRDRPMETFLLEGVQRDLELLSRVCGRLLLLARLDRSARDSSLLEERVDLGELVAELVDQMTPAARERGVQLWRGASSPLPVRGSRPLLAEAILSLLDNAIRATPAGGGVGVSVDTHDDGVWLSVVDGGPGVPPEERERIFLPFYRISRTVPGVANDKTGLGLAIAWAIAQAHGGRVEVDDAPGGGSVFRLVLPPGPAPRRGH